MSDVAKKRYRHYGIRGKMVFCLVIFTAFILIAIWVLQIRLLSYFYEREKFSELEGACEDLIEYIQSDTLRGQALNIADKNNICIRVFSVSDGKSVQITDAGSNMNCMIHHLTEDLITDLYERAKSNGGVYDKRMDFKNAFSGEEDEFLLPGFHSPNDSIHAIYVRHIEQESAEYLLLLDSELTPLSTTVKTLQVQFIWSTGLLLVSALLLAFFLSRLVASPLRSITQKARRLATGDYTANFEGVGYREVEELADTLNFAAKEIGTADTLQKELIANISHDLRTPLTMIKGYGEMMRDLPGENNEENAQIIIDETTRLSELVSDLLDISKLQSGAKKPEPEVFDMVLLMQETLHRYEMLIKRDGYCFDVLLPEGQAYVFADRTMILQVIYNLINNAVNYTGESRRVRVTVALQSDRVRVAIADEGEGISPDQIESIWDRYYRVDKVHKRAVMGTGLGLSIVKQVLEAHHAQYGVESAVGVGSVFWFEIPLVKNE